MVLAGCVDEPETCAASVGGDRFGERGLFCVGCCRFSGAASVSSVGERWCVVCAEGIVNLTSVVAFFSICQGNSMSVSYKYHRFPIEIVGHCVWLYYTFPLSYRDIEKIMLYRGIEVTYEAIRKGCKKFAQEYANQIRRCRPKPADKWPLGEVVITIKG